MENSKSNELILVPRIRLDFTVVKIGRPTSGNNGSIVVDEIKRSISTWASLYKLTLPESDIHLDEVIPVNNNGPTTHWEVGRGTMYLRHLNFKGDIEEKLKKGRQFLVKEFSPLNINNVTMNLKHEIWASTLVSEDADQLMALVSKPSYPIPGSIHKPPMIILKGVPSQWFAQHPESSKPSKRLLRIFFENYGKISDINTSENIENATCFDISILYESYEECYNALKKLCSFSLQKKGDSGISWTADYEVTLKDTSVSFSNPEKRPCGDDSAGLSSKRVCPSSDDVSMSEDEFRALKLFKAMLKEQLMCVKAKMKAYKTRLSSSS